MTGFVKANYKRIEEEHPDLILGHSDIQKQIAYDLIEKGHDVWISNHRSLDGILRYIQTLSLLVDQKERGLRLVEKLTSLRDKFKGLASQLKRRPKVYFEEWDEPKISAIDWVREMIDVCGGDNIISHESTLLAKDRILTDEQIINANPDLIIGCWCGKKVDIESIYKRVGWNDVKAIKNKMVYEVEPEVFLQPGPAPFLDGLEILFGLIEKAAQIPA